MNLRLYRLDAGTSDSRVYEFCYKNSNPFVTIEVGMVERTVKRIEMTDPTNIDALTQALEFVNENEYSKRWDECHTEQRTEV